MTITAIAKAVGAIFGTIGKALGLIRDKELKRHGGLEVDKANRDALDDVRK